MEYILTEIKSPFAEDSIAHLKNEERVIFYKGKKINYIHSFYVCEKTNMGFTTTELDAANMEIIRRLYNGDVE